MKTAFLFPALFLLSLVPAGRVAAADGLLYFPATIENTTLADGTTLKVVAKAPAPPGEITRGTAEAEPNNHWHWREGAGSGAGDQRGVLAASGVRDNDAPMLRTVVSGLKPQTDYQVFGFYWVAGFESDDADPAGDTQWDIRLGCGKAKMMGYGHRDNTGLPGTIGRRDNGDGVVRQMDAPLRPATGNLLDRDGDRRLFRAPLGCERTDAKGTLVVYVDDQAGDSNEGRTWYDGIGVMPGTTKADVGSGSPGALHLAVRCGDWEMVRRELAAGADLNAVDHDGLTPMFYLAAALDAERVAAFLKAGAKPDVEGQTLTPLWAAATSGDVKLTKMLLDAGAKVPTEPLPKNPLRDTLKAASQSHPAVAAIYSGSLKVLKLLLGKEPKLDLDRLYASDWTEADKNSTMVSFAVRDAITHNHAEMAEFLIQRGCQISGKEAKNLPRSANPSGRLTVEYGSQSLLIAAIMTQPPMRGVVAALARRGVAMVDRTPGVDLSGVKPWDALTAAARAGDSYLVSQLLPSATNADPAYKTALMVLAESGGNEQVLTLIQKQFGGMKVPRWEGAAPAGESERETGAARVFKPRSVPSKPRTEVKGKRVLAVISSPKAAGPAAVIAAKASASNSWIVVEREQIEALLQEREFTKPWEDRAQNLGSLGDRLSADLLILVTQLKAANLSLLRLEAVDVKTGLLIDRLHLDEKEFKPDAFCDNYLADVRKKLDDHLAGGTLTAVTLLPITVDVHMTAGLTLEGLLQAGLLQEIDNCPGMIALTREQMQPMVEEKTFQQPSALWGAAWTIEGGLKPLENDQVELALRVRSLGGNAASHDVKVAGNSGDVQALVKSAWQHVLTAMRGAGLGAQAATSAAPEQRAKAEAARLLREAEWLSNIQRWHEAAPLADAALYLGADPVKAVLLRLNIRMTMRHYWHPGLYSEHNQPASRRVPEDPMSPERADQAARSLEEYLELLRLNSESLDRLEKILPTPGVAANRFHPFDYFWRNLETFIFYRSILQPQHMRPQELAILKEYDMELESHLKRMFALIGPDPVGHATLMRHCEFNPLHFRAVPALGPALAGAIVRAWNECTWIEPQFYATFLKCANTAYFIQSADNCAAHENIAALAPNRQGLMCDMLEKALAGGNNPFQELHQAEIAFLRSSGEQRAMAARQLLKTRIAMSYKLKTPSKDWVPLKLLSRCIPMLANRYDSFDGVPSHGDLFIPALVQSPESCPDMCVHHSFYRSFRGKWFASYQNVQEMDTIRRGIALSLDRRINETAAKGLGATAWDDILSGVRLLDKTLGVTFADDLEPRIAKLRPQGPVGSFGSKGQFPILSFEGTVDTRLLADVRRGATEHPAMITRSMIDPKNHHILWLALQPYQEWDLKLDEPLLDAKYRQENLPDWGSDIPPITARQPWLVAIDCRDGRTIHQINLATIRGLWSQDPPETMPIDEFGRPFVLGMFTNDTHLLVQIRWGKLPFSEKKRFETALLSINRETGEIQKLPRDIKALCDPLPKNIALPYAVAGVGDSFFVLERHYEPLYEADDHNRQMLWQFKPGAEPKLLTQSGRRPEESPFDARDQKIRLIRADGGRLLVASSWDHFAYYDPSQEKWQDAPVHSDGDWQEHVRNIDNSTLRTTLIPYNPFGDTAGGKDAYQFGLDKEITPGRLKFKIGGGPLLQLPVSLKVPDSYRARFQFNSDPAEYKVQLPTDPYEWITTADVARSNRVVPAILNQTDEHFVLAMRWVAVPNRMIHIEASNPPCLPFLWILDKKAAAAGMKRRQAK
jgi:hypothetical protein